MFLSRNRVVRNETGRAIIDEAQRDFVKRRNFHVQEIGRLETIIANATSELEQHRELYEAVNTIIFQVHNPKGIDLTADEIAIDESRPREPHMSAVATDASGEPVFPFRRQTSEGIV